MDEESFYLDPERIINRTLWGTDYNPDDVGFSAIRKHLMKESEDYLIRQMLLATCSYIN